MQCRAQTAPELSLATLPLAFIGPASETAIWCTGFVAHQIPAGRPDGRFIYPCCRLQAGSPGQPVSNRDEDILQQKRDKNQSGWLGSWPAAGWDANAESLQTHLSHLREAVRQAVEQPHVTVVHNCRRTFSASHKLIYT